MDETSSQNSDDMQRTSPELSSNPDIPDQQQLDQALLTALDAGQVALADQIHYILALSQMLGLPPAGKSYRPRLLNVAQARLAAEIEFSQVFEHLNPDQVRSIYRSTRLVNDMVVRLNLQTRLLNLLPVSIRSTVIRDIWQQINELDDPVEQARLLLRLADLPPLPAAEARPGDPLQFMIELAEKIPGIEARLRSLAALASHLPIDRAVPLYESIFNNFELAPDSLRTQIIVQLAPRVPPDLRVWLIQNLEKIRTPVDRARSAIALSLANLQDLDLRLETLDLIAAIPNEEECVDALIEFIPAVEEASPFGGYPVTLQHALAITVGLTKRGLRAKALVALSPNLTPDLRGEALAVIHGVSSERDRAVLLGDLAPRLPDSMLIASLAVAHTMREPDSRAYALRVLAHHVSPGARTQTLQDALTAASILPNILERIQAFIGLFDLLSGDLKQQVQHTSLLAIQVLENENVRARAIGLLSPYLNAELLTDAVKLAMTVEDSQQRLNTLISLVPYLTGEQQTEVLIGLLDCARAMPFEYRRARALVSIAASVPSAMTDEILAMTDNLHDPYDRASIYIALVQNQSPELRPPLINRAWSLVRKIDDGYDRASMLVAITPYLPPSTYPEIIKQARVVIESISDEYEKASAISLLAPLLTDETLIPRPPPPLPTQLDLLSRGLEAILNIPQQPLCAQLLAETVPFWLRLDEDQRFQLWWLCALRLKALPLADVLLCLSVIVPVIRVMAGDQHLDKITRLLNAQRDKQPGSKQLKTGEEGHER